MPWMIFLSRDIWGAIKIVGFILTKINIPLKFVARSVCVITGQNGSIQIPATQKGLA